jgi:hypothetical protein
MWYTHNTPKKALSVQNVALVVTTDVLERPMHAKEVEAAAPTLPWCSRVTDEATLHYILFGTKNP